MAGFIRRFHLDEDPVYFSCGPSLDRIAAKERLSRCVYESDMDLRDRILISRRRSIPDSYFEVTVNTN